MDPKKRGSLMKKTRINSDVPEGGYVILVALLSSLVILGFVIYTQNRIEHRGEYPKIYLKWEKIDDVKARSEDNGDII